MADPADPADQTTDDVYNDPDNILDADTGAGTPPVGAPDEPVDYAADPLDPTDTSAGSAADPLDAAGNEAGGASGDASEVAGGDLNGGTTTEDSRPDLEMTDPESVDSNNEALQDHPEDLDLDAEALGDLQPPAENDGTES